MANIIRKNVAWKIIRKNVAWKKLKETKPDENEKRKLWHELKLVIGGNSLSDQETK